MAVFETGAHRTLTDVFQTFTGRGVEYADTWALEHQHPLFTATIRKLVGEDDSRAANRLIRCAGLVDTKISRLTSGGEYKRDSYIDLIAYLANLAELHEQYVNRASP